MTRHAEQRSESMWFHGEGRVWLKATGWAGDRALGQELSADIHSASEPFAGSLFEYSSRDARTLHQRRPREQL